MNHKEMLQFLKNNNKIYKSITNIKFFNKDYYDYQDLINNEDFLLLIKDCSFSLTTQDNIIYKNKLLYFTKYVNPLLVIKKKYELNMKSIENSNNQKNKLLNNLGNFKDNELHLIIYDDFKNLLNKDFIKHYFPLVKNEYNEKINTYENISETFIKRNKYTINLPKQFKKSKSKN